MIEKLKRLTEHEGFMKYFRNTSWLFAENMFRMFFGLFVGVFVARYLGPDRYGLLSYAQSFAAIFSIIATMGIDGILVRELVAKPQKYNVLMGSAFIIHLFGAFISMFFLIATIYCCNINDSYTNKLIIIITTSVFFQSFMVIDSHFRAEVYSKYIMYASFMTVTIISILKIVLVIMSAPLIYFAWAILFNSIILALHQVVFYYKNNMSIFKWSYTAIQIREFLKDGWPLILSGIATAVYMNTDKIMLKELLNAKGVGEYAVASSISSVWYFVPMIISSSLFPAIVKAKKQGENIYLKRLQQLYDLVTWIAIIIAIFMTLFSDWLVQLLFGEAFANASGVLTIHIWTGVFIALWAVASKWFTIENLLQNIMYRTFIGALLNIVLNYMMIPKYGVEGAAWATLISYVFINYLSMAIFTKTRKSFYQQTRAFNLLRIIKEL